MRIVVISLFPSMFDALTQEGVIGRAMKQGLIELQLISPRDYTENKHRRVDDRPFGGGPGMLMSYQPLRDAILAAKALLPEAPVIYLSPQGRRFDQQAARALVQVPQLIFVCGRYEGIDERVMISLVDQEWSLGDFVLSGGELPAMSMIDAIGRLLPGVLGDEQSAVADSFTEQLLDCPHYTRPETIDGMSVPEVLLSGDHQAIAKWRQQQALGRTWQRRPELLAKQTLSADQLALLNDFKQAQQAKALGNEFEEPQT